MGHTSQKRRDVTDVSNRTSAWRGLAKKEPCRNRGVKGLEDRAINRFASQRQPGRCLASGAHDAIATHRCRTLAGDPRKLLEQHEITCCVAPPCRHQFPGSAWMILLAHALPSPGWRRLRAGGFTSGRARWCTDTPSEKFTRSSTQNSAYPYLFRSYVPRR